MAKQKPEIPVRLGERLELTVENLASSGDGICHHQGYTLFIPTAVPGDRVVGEVVKITPRFGVTRIVATQQLSSDRVQPPCTVFPQCGGCKLQDLPYEKQLQFKEQVVIDNLTRIGRLKLPDSIQTLAADQPYHYRNKASFAVQEKAGTLRIGFFRQGTHEVEDSSECETLAEPINAVKETVRELLIHHRIPIFDEVRHQGILRGLVVRHSPATQETLLGLVTTDANLPVAFIQELETKTRTAGTSLQGIVQNINPCKTNVILGNRNRVLCGRDYIIDNLAGLKFHLSLTSFFQVNPSQAVVLYNLVQQWVKPNPGLVLDAYCGVGGISFWLANHPVIGVEEAAEAVEDARKSAKLNQIETCRFLTGPLESHISNLAKKESINTLILDPPRKGCSKEVMEIILYSLKPNKIIYVSCNPATLARDLGKLCQEAYSLVDLRIVDMFPQTQHIETAVSLEAI